jgi:hypothetical protein
MLRKDILEVAANVIVVVAGIVFLGTWVANRQSTRPRTTANVTVAPGTQLAPPPGYSWEGHAPTLVLVLRQGCHFCKESLPFYKSLAELEHSGRLNAHLLAVLSDQEAEGRVFMTNEGLEIQSIFGVNPSTPRAAGTPTLVLIDGHGKVLQSWVGKLDAGGEAEVKRVVVKGTNRSG